MSTLQIIEELENWNIYLVPHPSDRYALDLLHNITLVATATEENNNTNITCEEFADTEDIFNFSPMVSSSKTKKLLTIGKDLLVRSV